MITLNELCVQLLPPNEHLKFKNLILDEQRIIYHDNPLTYNDRSHTYDTSWARRHVMQPSTHRILTTPIPA